MLNRYIPEPRLCEIDHVELAAPPERVYAVARHFDAGRSPIVRALFTLRTLPDRLLGRTDQPPELRIDNIGTAGVGFQLLADEPGRGFVVGAIGRFWESVIPFVDVAPEAFSSYAEPGLGKVAWGLFVEPLGDSGSRLILELRVTATDEAAWQKLRAYLRVIGPFSHFIRRHLLSLIAEELGTVDAAEDRAVQPGDELLPEARTQSTQGITIAAPPAAIWPWLLQMGGSRAGWYSYDFLDNAGRASARVIEPALQTLREGDLIPAQPQGGDGYEVLRIEPERLLLLGGLYDLDAERQRPFAGPRPERFWQVTWAFVLTPLDAGSTRLTVRARADFAPESSWWLAAFRAPVHHFMQREQLHNLKARAEGQLPHAQSNAMDVVDGISGALIMLLDLATPFLRPARSNWGLDEATANRPYPGDEHVPHPSWSWTHGIEIDAPADAVWPWVAQIGQDKAGFYSYQWLENLVGCDVQNAARVHPEWGQPRLGDPLRLHPQAPPIPVSGVEPGRWFYAATDGKEPPPPADDERVSVSWLFFVEPLEGGRSRFISRFRSHYAGKRLATRLAYGPYVTESIGFAMDRRMLLGVKERVEAERARTPTG